MSAQSLFFVKGILLTKPFQASQSWNRLSFYENKILVQNCLLNEWTLASIPNKQAMFTVPIFSYGFGNDIVETKQKSSKQNEKFKIQIVNLWSKSNRFITYPSQNWKTPTCLLSVDYPYQNWNHPYMFVKCGSWKRPLKSYSKWVILVILISGKKLKVVGWVEGERGVSRPYFPGAFTHN